MSTQPDWLKVKEFVVVIPVLIWGQDQDQQDRSSQPPWCVTLVYLLACDAWQVLISISVFKGSTSVYDWLLMGDVQMAQLQPTVSLPVCKRQEMATVTIAQNFTA